MKSRIKTSMIKALKQILILSTAFFVFQGVALAGPEIVPVEGASYNVNNSILDNLKVFSGEKVSLTLASGTVIIGFVKEVGNHLIHLEKIQGKEYYDGLIRLDNIIAVNARFRKPKR